MADTFTIFAEPETLADLWMAKFAGNDVPNDPTELRKRYIDLRGDVFFFTGLYDMLEGTPGKYGYKPFQVTCVVLTL